MSLGDIRSELYAIAQTNRDEIPYFDAALADHRDMRESAQSAASSIGIAGRSSRVAGDEVTNAAGQAAEARTILEEARIRLGNVVVSLTEAQGHNSDIAGNIDQAGAAVQAAGQHADGIHANLSSGHDLAYQATSEYIRVMSAEDREPVPTATAHMSAISNTTEGVHSLQHRAEDAGRAVAGLAGKPDELTGLHRGRLVEAEHIAAEIDRLHVRLDALVASLADLNYEHRVYEGATHEAQETIKRLGRRIILEGEFKDLAYGAEQVARTAEQVGDQITGQ